MTVLQQWATSQANPEIPVNENFTALEHMAVYGKDATTTTGLTWGYLGGRWGGFAVTAGTLALTASNTNYIVVARADGSISVSTSSTNWDDGDNYCRVYKLTVGGSTVTAIEDHRVGESGIFPAGAAGGGSSGPAPLITESTTSRDVTPSDAGSYIRFTSTGAKTAAFDSADGFAAPEEYFIANRASSDDLTLTGIGVTLNAPKGGTLVLEPGDTATVKFISSTVADVYGSTSAYTAPTDPYFSSVTALLHFEGSDGSTTFTDEIGNTWAASGNAQIDTAQFKFGTASGLFDGTDDQISASGAGFEFGTGDFTVEFFVRFAVMAGTAQYIMSTAGTPYIWVTLNTTNYLEAYIHGSSKTSTSPLSVDTWYHVAISRTSGVAKFFLDGVQQGTDVPTTAGPAGSMRFGGASGLAGSNRFLNGWIDEARVTKGVGRYAANFTVPATAFPDA